MNKSNANENDIDYLHPNGKPQTEPQPSADPEKFDGRELEAAARREKCALIDADGHHVCSEECKKSHNS